MHFGQSVQLLNVKLLVHHVTSRLWKVEDTTESRFIKISNSQIRMSNKANIVPALLYLPMDCFVFRSPSYPLTLFLPPYLICDVSDRPSASILASVLDVVSSNFDW